MSERGYASALKVAARLLPKLSDGPALPDSANLEALVDAAFWASLRREEGVAPKISLTLLPPDDAGTSIRFASALPLTAETLVRLAPAVERPGIHLGVACDGGGLRVWGATRSVPPFGFVLEVVAPGLLVIKRRRTEASAKFHNVAVLEGAQLKVIDDAIALPGFGAPGPIDVLMELAVSMRAHGRGGALLVTPRQSDAWRRSIIQPVRYAVDPPFAKLGKLLARPDEQQESQLWQDAFHRTVESIAGLTSVDGATVINDAHEVLAFGAKIRRSDGTPGIEEVVVSEPVEGAVARRMPVLEAGGTRHLSAAQFAHDQRDAMALVASQDGRFTVFKWSGDDGCVRAMRVESVLL